MSTGIQVHVDVLLGERHVGHLHLADDGRLEIGREGRDYRGEDAAMSRRHFLLRLSGENLLLEDLGSSGGTYLNGAQVTGSCEVASGDRIEAGDSVFVVRIDGSLVGLIAGTGWRVQRPLAGFRIVDRLGLSRPHDDGSAETVVCRADRLDQADSLEAYARRQCDQLRLVAPDLEILEQIASPPGQAPERLLLRHRFSLKDQSVNQWLVFVREGEHLGVLAWSFRASAAPEREQVRDLLTHLVFEASAGPVS